MTISKILSAANEVSARKLTKAIVTKRVVHARLVMASDDLDIYIGVNTVKFYARANGNQYILD
jgi:hypothetical protein